MGIGRIALIRRRLHAIDRQAGQQQRLAAERIVVSTQNGAAIGLDAPRERVQCVAAGVLRFAGTQPYRGRRDFLAADRFLPRWHALMIWQPRCTRLDRGVP